LELQQILASDPWPGLPLWCDRRVDRSRVVDLELQNETIQTVLERLAEACRAAVVILDDTVVLLPQPAATRLPVVLADARRQVRDLPAALRQPLLRKSERRWPRLAQPRQLWQEWLASTKVTTLGDPLPHDVWDAGALPAMPLVDQLVLLAFGFDRHWICQSVSGGLQIQWVPLSDAMPVEMVIEDAHQRAQWDALRESWDQSFPGLRRVEEKPPRVAGSLADSAVLWDRLELNRVTPGGARVAINRYTVKIEGQTAEEVIRFIAQQTQRTVQMEEGLGERLATPIHLDVRDVPLEDLLQQVGRPAGLLIQLGRTQISVRRPPPTD
jgi:hypothetical protein